MSRASHIAWVVAAMLPTSLAFGWSDMHAPTLPDAGDGGVTLDGASGDATTCGSDTFADACAGQGGSGCGGFGGGGGTGGQGGGAAIALMAIGSTSVSMTNGGLVAGNGGVGGNGGDGQQGSPGDAGAQGTALVCSLTPCTSGCNNSNFSGGAGGPGGVGGPGGQGGGGAGGPRYFYATRGGATVVLSSTTQTQFKGNLGIGGAPNGIAGVQGTSYP